MNCLELQNLDNYVVVIAYSSKVIGSWTQIKKVKTEDFTFVSIILKETQRENEFLEKLYEWSGYKKMELLYRGTRDGSTSNIFHNKCDNQGPNICLYKNDKGNIFGGYTSIPWTNNGNFHSDPDSFLFTLTNIHETQPTKFPISDSNYSVYHNSKRGPSFGCGCEIYIYEDFLKTDSYSSFPYSYKDILIKGKSVFTEDLNNNTDHFKIQEIEVFKLSK